MIPNITCTFYSTQCIYSTSVYAHGEHYHTKNYFDLPIYLTITLEYVFYVLKLSFNNSYQQMEDSLNKLLYLNIHVYLLFIQFIESQSLERLY